ncbi:MAG: 30S ribosomal protein S20 [Pseudomonadota bacterium]|nr:30S ribosomal protein S20 [Pseudomonadota bacterium]
MANIKSAKKRAQQAEVRRQRNVAMRSRVRTKIKRVLNAIRAGDLDTARKAYKDAEPTIDSMVNKGIVHRNKAARHKQRLNAGIKKLAEAQA